MSDFIIPLDGRYIDLTNSDYMGCAIRALNVYWLHVVGHEAAPKTLGHVASSMLPILCRWAANETTHEDRHRVAKWVKEYDL